MKVSSNSNTLNFNMLKFHSNERFVRIAPVCTNKPPICCFLEALELCDQI